MKRTDLERALRELGYWPDGGTKHEKWTNGSFSDWVPRHKEISEGTARNILKRCELAAKRKKESEKRGK